VYVKPLKFESYSMRFGLFFYVLLKYKTELLVHERTKRPVLGPRVMFC